MYIYAKVNLFFFLYKALTRCNNDIIYNGSSLSLEKYFYVLLHIKLDQKFASLLMQKKVTLISTIVINQN